MEARDEHSLREGKKDRDHAQQHIDRSHRHCHGYLPVTSPATNQLGVISIPQTTTTEVDLVSDPAYRNWYFVRVSCRWHGLPNGQTSTCAD
jgi:hypothetical protein